MLSLVPYKNDSSIVPRLTSLDRLFDDVLSSWSFFDRYASDVPSHRTDIVDGKLRLEIDLPGLKAENIDLHFEENKLVVSGKIRESEFKYAFLIDKKYDIESIEATMDAGVLTLVSPLKTPVNPRKIEINVKK